MSLRVRLIRAFLLLAVLPLTGVSVYSYLTTERAYRRAVGAEAAAAAEDLNGRLGATTRDLGQRFERLGELPFGSLLASGPRPDEDAAERLLAGVRARIGDVAPLVESLEFIPSGSGAPPGAPAPSDSPPPAGERHTRSRSIVIAPPPPAPGAPAAPAAAGPPGVPAVPGAPSAPGGAAAGWVLRFQGMAEAAAAVGEQLSREAGRLEAELARQRAQAESSASDQADEADRGVQEAERARAHVEREAQAARVRQQLAEKALHAAQLALSPGREDRAQAGRVASETAALAMRELGQAIAREARLRYAPRRGYSFEHRLRRDGAELGTVRTRIKPQQVLAGVFERTRRGRGEIPFALDPEGKLYAAEGDRPRLEKLGLRPASGTAASTRTQDDWVVVSRRDEESGLTLGIARPLGEGLREIRTAAVRNLGYGLGMTGLALVGILPLSRRLTRDVGALTEGATRLARGELDARVEVRSRDEVGRLAEAFNRMAADLAAHQAELIEKERLRKELEMGRRIQEEMLPHERLRVPFAEAKGLSIPAREVGGDFFNYFPVGDGQAALMIGDVSGKGVGAALLMANLQATLRARLPLEQDLVALARHLDHEIDRTTPTTVYLTAFIGVLDSRQLRYVNAGHNAPLLLRADGAVVSLDSTGRPLGLYPGGGYEERRIALAEGDWLFLYTDGVVECEDAAGEPFGTERLQALLAARRGAGLEAVLSAVEQAVREHRGGREADDDATVVVLRVGAGATTAA